jgi:hypothetical protein
MAKHHIALLDKLRERLVSKLRGKLSKGILFLQDNSTSHKAAITHQKLPDLYFEGLKHPDLALRTATSFLTSGNTSRRESSRGLKTPHWLRTDGF